MIAIRNPRLLAVLSGQEVQYLLNGDVAAAAGSQAYDLIREAATLTMSAYRFSGPVADQTESGQLVSFVIDLAKG